MENEHVKGILKEISKGKESKRFSEDFTSVDTDQRSCFSKTTNCNILARSTCKHKKVYDIVF